MRYIINWVIFIIGDGSYTLYLFKTLGIDEPLHIKRRKVIKPGFIHSPWKSAYIRQHRIDTNWRRGELKSPKVTELLHSRTESTDQCWYLIHSSWPAV